MKVLFAGSPAIAVPCLEALCNINGIELAGVLTNPDTPRGRSGSPAPTDIGEAAQRLFSEKGIDILMILKPEKLDASVRQKISTLNPDILISFAYGRIFGPKFLSLFPLGGINIHPSLLPKYRGPTPIQAAILNRDKVTGITIQTLAKEMDQGDIIAVEQLQLTGKETSGSLSDIVSKKAAVMLNDTLVKIMAEFNDNSGLPKNQAFFAAKARAQDHSKAVYCKLISRDDGIIDWNLRAAEIEAKIRAFDPWPLCRTFHNGRELFILSAEPLPDFAARQWSDPGINPKESSFGQDTPGMVLGIDKQYGILIRTGSGILAVTKLQYQAKKALNWRDFVNGARDFSSGRPVQLGEAFPKLQFLEKLL